MKEKLNLKFEEALQELEGIVAAMEGGKLPLEEMMKQFERGMQLSKFCSAKLGETEKRIEVLMKNAEGEDEWQPMRDTAETPPPQDELF